MKYHIKSAGHDFLKFIRHKKAFRRVFSAQSGKHSERGLHEYLQRFFKVSGRSSFLYLSDTILRALNSSGPNTIAREDWIQSACEKKLRRVYLFYMQLIITDLAPTVQAYKIFSNNTVELQALCRLLLSRPCPWYSANHPWADMGHHVQWLRL